MWRKIKAIGFAVLCIAGLLVVLAAMILPGLMEYACMVKFLFGGK